MSIVITYYNRHMYIMWHKDTQLYKNSINSRLILMSSINSVGKLLIINKMQTFIWLMLGGDLDTGFCSSFMI